MQLRTCKYCNVTFDSLNGRQFSNHVRWCPSNTTNGDKGRSELSKSLTIYNERKSGIVLTHVKNCLHCGKTFEVNCKIKDINSKNYCSIKCKNTVGAKASRTWSIDMRIKASDKMKTVWSNTDFASRLMRNGKTIFTSKSEVEIREHFIKNFPIDEWTFGGCIRFNGIGIVRDLYSKVLKICIEYDGIWHFKDIHGQLETKKLKDKALEEWCLCNGWRLIRIDEVEYLKDCHGALQKLVELAYKCEDKIVKIGDRY